MRKIGGDLLEAESAGHVKRSFAPSASGTSQKRSPTMDTERKVGIATGIS